MKESLLTKLSLWWLKHHKECIYFWPRFCWSLSIMIFIIGFSKGFELAEVAIFMLLFNLILNLAVYCTIKTMRSNLMNLPEGKIKEEVHQLSVNIIKERINRR